MEPPETCYTKSGEVNIAYQVTGDGPFDLVHIPPFTSHVELAWTVPSMVALNERLASFCRVIRFDKRGTGMSDQVAGAPTLEERMDDVRAVMDAVGSERAAILGVSEGGPMSLLFAASYPERVWALVLCGTYARVRWAPDYTWGYREEDESPEPDPPWAIATRRMARGIAPTASESEQEALANYIRLSSSPGAAEALSRMNLEIDVRHVLPSIRVPTLILNRTGERPSYVHGARYLAEHIPGARHVELPGVDHAIMAGDRDAVLNEIEQFLTQEWASGVGSAEPDRVLATILFTDLVGSTARAAELGDRAWLELLEEHHSRVRRQLVRHRGVELDTAGDGFFARFDGPARAIRCARAITDAVADLGLEVRAGLHSGECELLDGKVAGIAVAIGARVAAQARSGEILVSQTVKDLVAGSGIAFEDRGAAELKGVPGEWRLFAVESV
jgi:pimeloyl-ACP methyl ester carboxylesterase